MNLITIMENSDFNVDDILSKCKYAGDTCFSLLEDIWKKKFMAEFHSLNKNTKMMILKKDSINLLKKADVILVDCRIFALLYSSLKEDGCSIILQENSEGIEIMVPENCFYLSLANNINVYQLSQGKKIELKSVLNDNQGQWLCSEIPMTGIHPVYPKCLC